MPKLKCQVNVKVQNPKPKSVLTQLFDICHYDPKPVIPDSIRNPKDLRQLKTILLSIFSDF